MLRIQATGRKETQSQDSSSGSNLSTKFESVFGAYVDTVSGLLFRLSAKTYSSVSEHWSNTHMNTVDTQTPNMPESMANSTGSETCCSEETFTHGSTLVTSRYTPKPLAREMLKTPPTWAIQQVPLSRAMAGTSCVTNLKTWRAAWRKLLERMATSTYALLFMNSRHFWKQARQPVQQLARHAPVGLQLASVWRLTKPNTSRSTCVVATSSAPSARVPR
mmetsp:Transcript_121679/g.330553  ORF Transcript_121679/g.330553 Transcript_121679/m.330553 type:complete len:219 (-) Transcript_121679:164-820(-)